MPSNHPIPTLAAIALSLYASARAVERLPRVEAVEPHEVAALVYTATSYRAGDYL